MYDQLHEEGELAGGVNASLKLHYDRRCIYSKLLFTFPSATYPARDNYERFCCPARRARGSLPWRLTSEPLALLSAVQGKKESLGRRLIIVRIVIIGYSASTLEAAYQQKGSTSAETNQFPIKPNYGPRTVTLPIGDLSSVSSILPP